MGNPALQLVPKFQAENQIGIYGEIAPDILELIYGVANKTIAPLGNVQNLLDIGNGPVILGCVDLDEYANAAAIQSLMQKTNELGIAVLQTSTPIYLRGYVASNHLHVGGESTLTGNEAAIILPKFFRLADTGATGKFSVHQILEANIS